MKTRNKSPIVYICSPYSGDVERNTEMARRYSRYAIDQGCIPITPHLWLPSILSEATEREKAIEIDLELMEITEELWVCGDVISEGMRREIAHATEIGIPIHYRYRKEKIPHVCN